MNRLVAVKLLLVPLLRLADVLGVKDHRPVASQIQGFFSAFNIHHRLLGRC
jgi:hypothetical protein